MKYLIIGNSTAGLAAVEAIRESDRKGTITVVSDERHQPYSRPLITYWLAGKADDRKMHYKGKDYMKKKRVNLVLGKRAVRLDTRQKTVTLDDGKMLEYDRLLIATGGTPINPQLKGSNLKGVYNLTTWDDAKKVGEYVRENLVKHATVIGGGLIGLKATEALAELGLKVTVLELSDRILASTLDRKASEMMIDYLRKKGIDVMTGNTAEEILGGEMVEGVKLKDGRTIKTQMVIVAIGVRPNTSLAGGTPIKVNRGILVDGNMQTNVKGVYAAGDAAEAMDTLMEAPRTIAIWPLAVRQGRVAGQNMAGRKTEYGGGFPMNSVEICGMPTISAGITDPKEKGYELLEQQKAGEGSYRKVVLKDGRLVGMILLGDVERAGIFTGLIEGKVDVSAVKEHLLHDDFGLIMLPKGYKKHLVTGPGMEV
ncbi:MAG: FAD-dependent oxidoreductase [Candidatus Altiarchaeota archaeon]